VGKKKGKEVQGKAFLQVRHRGERGKAVASHNGLSSVPYSGRRKTGTGCKTQGRKEKKKAVHSITAPRQRKTGGGANSCPRKKPVSRLAGGKKRKEKGGKKVSVSHAEKEGKKNKPFPPRLGEEN